jgi:hypothetical protein
MSIAMRKISLTVLIFALFALAVSVLPAYAAPQADKPNPKKTPVVTGTPPAAKAAAGKPAKENPKKGKPQHFKGTLDSISASSMTLALEDGTKVTLALGAGTRIHVPGVKNITPDQVVTGSRAMVLARPDAAGNLTAEKVQVIPGKPAKLHRVGLVTALSAGSISIQDKFGTVTTFVLNQDAKILPPKRAASLALGSRVTIIARRDPSGGPLTAKGVVVHPIKGAGEAEDEDD